MRNLSMLTPPFKIIHETTLVDPCFLIANMICNRTRDSVDNPEV